MGELMQDAAAIILAAGRSARLGSPKQLLVHEGQTFIRRSALSAIEAGFSKVFVVLGAAMEDVAKELEGLAVVTLVNEGWEEGMGSSIRKAIEVMMSGSPVPERLLIMVCDQPRVTAELLVALVAAQVRSGKPVAACRYGEVTGTPAVFDRTLYPGLLELKGDRGAGKLIASMPDKVGIVAFPDGADDIDTIEDYHRLNNETTGI
jgi:molybdenum cofactor cytidylyltransferase